MKKLLAALIGAATLLLSGCSMMGTSTASADGTMDSSTIIMYIGVMVVFFGAMYFIAIRPEKKRQKEQQNMLSTMAVGDTILTTSGFYGVVIDITNDTIIVEFGNNKNCRIPMQKSAVVQLEHPEGYEAPKAAETKDDKADKKGSIK